MICGPIEKNAHVNSGKNLGKKNKTFISLIFGLFSFIFIEASAQSVGTSCAVNGRTQMSATASEGLIQCRSGTWASATKTVGGVESKAMIQYQKMMITTVDACTDANMGFVGFNPTTNAEMICAGASSGWKERPSSSSSSSGGSSGSTSSSTPVVIGTTAYVNGGAPNYCSQINQSNGRGSAINYLLSCGTNQLCNRTGICKSLGTSAWKILRSGNSHTCGIKNDDSLWCWGSGGNGEMGDGSFTSRSFPISVGSGWKNVFLHSSRTCGIKTDDSLWCWGTGSNGGLGVGDTNPRSNPTQVSGGGAWKNIDMGIYHVCGIKTDNTLWCWGYNAFGQVGDGTTSSKNVPTQVSGGGTWKMISVSKSDHHTCGIKTDDTMSCWGYNNSGQLGDGVGNSRSVPTNISGGGTWKSVSLGSNFTCGTKTDNSLWCWGNGGSGQLGNNNNGSSITPVRESGNTTWNSVSSGYNYVCAIRFDNTLWCWGYSGNGQLGDSTNNSRSSPTQISGGGSWKSVFVNINGSEQTCGIKYDDTLWCWGWNSRGQLGDNSTSTRYSPTQVNGGDVWISASIGYYFACGIKVSGAVFCWGANDVYSVGDNTSIDRSVPTPVIFDF